VLDRAAIERAASGRMEDVLRDVAGLASFRRSDSRSAHPTSQGLTLRGLGGNAASRVTLSLDGVPQADPFGGWIAFTALDPHAIDRIRVTRGGGSVLSGPGAVAGTIDIDSRAPDEDFIQSMRAVRRVAIVARRAAAGGARWGGGFASLSGSFARGDGFVPVVAEDRGLADRRAPYRQGAARARLVQSIGGTRPRRSSTCRPSPTGATAGPISATIASAGAMHRCASSAVARRAGRRSAMSSNGASTASSPRSRRGEAAPA
jgi:outer membrane receptor protein involved in Fe transport